MQSAATQPANTPGVQVVHNGEQDIDKLPSPVHVATLKPVKPAEPPKPARDTSPAANASSGRTRLPPSSTA